MGGYGRRLGEVLAAALLAQTAAGCTVAPSSSEPGAADDSHVAREEPPAPEEPISAQHTLSCEEIRPAALGPGTSFIIRANAPEANCGPGRGDGAGSLALQNSGPLGSTAWNVVSREGVDTGNLLLGGDLAIDLLPQPRGFQVLRLPPGGATLTASSSEGIALRGVALTGSANEPFDVVANPRGGTLVVRWAPAGDTQVLTAQFLDATALPQSEPVELRTAPLDESRFILAGVDTRGRALLVWSEPGRDTLLGQWLKSNGKPLTEPFPIPLPASPSPNARLRPLVDGGIAIQQSDGQWVLRIPSGEAEALPAPDWLASHPRTDLVLIRHRRAHALVPPPVLVEGSGCQESLLLFDSDGTACGELAFPFGGGTCFGRQLGIALDGTVIQQIDLNIPANNQCAWRWWSRLLR